MKTVIPMSLVIPTEAEGPAFSGSHDLFLNLKMRLNVKLCRHIIAVCSLSFALPAALAQAPKSDTGLTDDPVFQKNCTKCHGRTAEGRHFGGPSLISEAATSASADDLRAIITKGKHQMRKYGGKPTHAGINSLVDEIKAAKKLAGSIRLRSRLRRCYITAGERKNRRPVRFGAKLRGRF